MRGPSAVSGPQGGSLSVECGYDAALKTYKKWWCRGAVWGSCQILVQTTGSEQKVKKDRVSIRDNHKNFTFTVTMEKLRKTDADVYWCGIERTGIDDGIRMTVSIGPAPTTVPTTTTATTNSTVPTTPEETTASAGMTNHLSDVRRKTQMLIILLPSVCAGFLLLLAVASLVAWRMTTQQKKGTSIEQPLEDDICYANLTLPRNGTSRKKGSSKSVASAGAGEVEVDCITMDPFPNEEVSYASLSMNTLDQELIYSNMCLPGAPSPLESHEEPTEYSAIKRA
ncbi:CMRF35-like molecule 1 [Tenrec ecaudatus]|uniref:CMRF35-like molecule 1 n=1 Tax=Tenrec ecaudatus TaxID=94439 RepID=UPI003F590A2E